MIERVMVDYAYIEADNLNQVVAGVAHYIQLGQGWEAIGGITARPNPSPGTRGVQLFVQALARYEEKRRVLTPPGVR